MGLLYVQLGRTGYLKNTAYRWSQMINNAASAVFGFIYIALWQAVAPLKTGPGDPYTREVMTNFVVLAQVIAWVAIFFPAGLGIHLSVRTGAIALEMARPVPFFPQVMAREAGTVINRALFRSVPLALMFAVTVGFPRPASPAALLRFIPSVLMASYVGLMLVYTVGMSSLWTTEIRFAHWIYNTAIVLLSGGWVPPDILPGILGKVVPYLPFTSQAFYPIRIYLGLSGPEALIIQAVWVCVLTVWCTWLTRRALYLVVVQGG